MHEARKRRAKRLEGTVLALKNQPLSGLGHLVVAVEGVRHEVPCEARMTCAALESCFGDQPANGKRIWFEIDGAGVLSRIGPLEHQPNLPFRFMGKDPRSFKLVVFAPTLAKARAYVKTQSLSSKAHRALKFVGRGNPENRDGWVAAVA